MIEVTGFCDCGHDTQRAHLRRRALISSCTQSCARQSYISNWLDTLGTTEEQLAKAEKRLRDFQSAGNAIVCPSPPAACAIAPTASACGTGMAGILGGAPRQAPALKPSLTSLKMVRRFCAITFSHAIFPLQIGRAHVCTPVT